MRYDYYVSGNWKNNERVSAMLVHKCSSTGFGEGTKMTLPYIAQLIKSGYRFGMIKWDYDKAKWFLIDEIEVLTLPDGLELLQPKRHAQGISLQMLIDLKTIIPEEMGVRPLISTRSKNISGK